MAVPLYERQAIGKTSPLKTPDVPGAVKGAFGEDIGEAQANLGAAGVKAGSALIERISRINYQRTKWQNEAKVANLAGQYFSDTLDMMHNTNTKTINRDGKDIEIEDGILDRSGYNMVGGTIEYVQREAVLRKNLLDQIEDPEYKAELEQKMLSHFLSRKESLINYEAAQHKVADVGEFNFLNKNLIESASISPYPAILSGIIANLEDNNAKKADRLGLDEQTQKFNTDADITKAVDNAVMTSLKSTGELLTARDLLDSVKDKISEKDYQDLYKNLGVYSDKMGDEQDARKVEFQKQRESDIMSTYFAELDKPLAERAITPQFLKEEHNSFGISTGFFTPMTNNLLGKEETRVKAGEAELKAEKLETKNAEEAQFKTALRKHTLTEEQIDTAADREKDPLDAGFALTMIAAVKAQAKQGEEPTPLESIIKFNELVERDVNVANREKAWFGMGKVPFEEITRFNADVIDSNTRKYITDKQMRDLLSKTSKTFYRDPVFQNALNQLAAQSKLYATPEMQARTKAEMYGSLIQKVIDKKNPREAVTEVIKERLNTELGEAVKTEDKLSKVTEENIQYTMKKHKLTREEVLKRLRIENAP